MAKKFINYCYTLNNWTEQEYEELKLIDCKYQIIGKEIGEQGTPHLQGYIHFKNARSFNAVRKMMKRWHIEPCLGNPNQNMRYCMKENNYIELGQRPNQGKRSDIEFVKNNYARPMKDLIMEVNSYQAIKFAETLKKYCEPQRNFKTYVYWFFGPTGSGKSRLAEEMFPDAYWCMDTNKWWEGYDGHEVVIINDMRADFCKFHVLLNILDRYPMRVETKGGSRQLLAKTIVITTNKHPNDLYNVNEDKEQLLRRIDNILFFGNGNGNGNEVVGNTNATTFEESEIIN